MIGHPIRTAIGAAVAFRLLTVPADVATGVIPIRFGIFGAQGGNDDLWLLPLVAYIALAAVVLSVPARRGAAASLAAAVLAACVYSATVLVSIPAVAAWMIAMIAALAVGLIWGRLRV